MVQALSPSELQAVICGAGQEADPLALHPDRWKDHVHLDCYDDDSPQVRPGWIAADLYTRGPATHMC